MELKKKIEIENDNHLAEMILTCVQLADDECVQLFNQKRVKEQNIPRAEILLTFDAFNDMRRAISREFNNRKKWNCLQDYIAADADYLESYVTQIREAFLTDILKKYVDDDAQMLAHHMTVVMLLQIGESIYKKRFNGTNKMIDKIKLKISNFGNKVQARAYNSENNDVNAQPAYDLVPTFLQKLAEVTKAK